MERPSGTRTSATCPANALTHSGEAHRRIAPCAAPAHRGGTSREALRLLALHDDAEREFDDVSGAERSLEQAETQGWTVVSVKDDWSTVFADLPG